MARITPKTNWVAHNIPVATDFNRIEGNNQQAFDEIDNLSDAIDTEEAARIAGDASLQLSKANKAIIGDNGGIGSIIFVTSTYVQVTSGMRLHTWAMPHSGIWFFVNPPIWMPSIFSGSSTSRETSNIGPTSCQFWRIG